jgi:hypothetical protein
MSAAQLAGGVALAAAAAACFDGAVALQAVETRAEASAPGRALLLRLVRRPRWLAATGLALAGWPLHVAALALAPLAVVQPTLALGLVLLLYLGARLLGEPAGARELVAVAAIAAGVGLLAWAAPQPGRVHAGTATVVAVLVPLGGLAALPWLRGRRTPGGLLIACAGAGYSATALMTKLVAEGLAGSQWATAAGWAALCATVGWLALGDEMAALQRVSAAGVATGAFVLQTIVPVLLAPVLVHEAWKDAGVAIAAGLAAVAAGSAVLAAAPGVRRLAGGAEHR